MVYSLSCMLPLNVSAGVWGTAQSSARDGVENHVICCLLGVHKFVPVLTAQGVMGWVPGSVQKKSEMIRLWN